MNRLWIVLTASLSVLLGANGLVAESFDALAPVDLSVATSQGPGCGLDGELPLPIELAAGPASGINNCPRYHRCICHCQQEGICCTNGGGQNCGEEELECMDVCVALLGPEEVCEATQCSLDWFCNFP